MHSKEPSTEPTPAGLSTEVLSTEKHSLPEPSLISDASSFTLKEPSAETKGDKEPSVMHSKKSSTEPIPDETPSTSKEPDSDVNDDKEPSTEPTLAGPSIEAPEPSSIPDPPPSTLKEPSSSRCGLHAMEFKGHCLTCDKSVCTVCFWNDGTHKRHVSDSIEAVYQERRGKVEQKVVKLVELTKSLQDDVQRNVEMLKNQEQSVNEEIDSICSKDKKSVTRIFEQKKRTLQMPLEFLSKKQKLVETLQLAPVEFLQQQPQIDKQLDEMLADPASRAFVPQHFDDIGCELIPSFEMRTFQLYQFETVPVWPLHVTVCGGSWAVVLQKTDTFFFAKATPPTKEFFKFPFKLLVVIVHPDLKKTIKKTYTLQGTFEKIEVVSINQLKTEGFIKNSALIVKIGLRPLNALVKNRLLEKQMDIMKKNSQFCVMYFNMKTNQQPRKWAYNSPTLTDGDDRQWCLAVNPLEETVVVGKNPVRNLEAFITLYRGTGTRCRYFIELLHKDPEKNVRRNGEHLFEKIGDKKGWSCFFEHQRLRSDPGFYVNGIFHFRFGVLPITEGNVTNV